MDGGELRTIEGHLATIASELRLIREALEAQAEYGEEEEGEEYEGEFEDEDEDEEEE